MKQLVLLAVFVPHLLFGQIRNSQFGTPVVEGNEPTIAINPNNPNEVWLSYNTSKLFRSKNAGENWVEVFPNSPYGFYGDPVLKIAKNGSVFLTHLSQNKAKKWPSWFDCIVFERSTNGVDFTSVCVGARENKMQDKPWFSIDEGQKSGFRGNIYLTWTEFDKYGSSNIRDSSRVRFARSSDDGISFSEPVTVSDKSGGAADDDHTSEGVTIAVLSDGVLCCFWSRSDTLWMDKSNDAGKTWGKDVAICKMPGGWNFEYVKGLIRTNGMPFAAVDKKDRIYVGFACAGGQGDFDVFYVFSKDKGVRFTEPIKVNDDQNFGDQFSPYLTIDEQGNVPQMLWYDKRNSETGHFCDIYTAKLCGKKPLKNIKITKEPIILPGQKQFMGDYIGLSVVNGKGMAAVTAYSDDIRKPCIQLIDWPIKLKKVRYSEDPVLLVNRNFDSDSLVICLSFPKQTSFTFEVKSSNRSLITNVFEVENPNGLNYQEMFLRKSVLGHGLFTFVIRRKGMILKKTMWLD
jgi:hypothetical protein